VDRHHLIFVYGTLRKGHGNHHLLKDAHWYGVGRTEEQYALYLVSGYPYVNGKESRYPIIGELYGVDDATLATLDRLEGHPRYYERREVAVTVDGERYSAWMYFHDPPGILMATGDFNSSVGAVP
jgi:gamma-glutamylcyclotransferase (GGCT)/AIG2-like uncharacterized protein YtfP